MACMRKIEKPSPTESPLLFEFDPKPAEEMLTALGGLPLVVQAFRSLGLPGISNNVGLVKHFLSRLLSFHLKEFFSFVFFRFLLSQR